MNFFSISALINAISCIWLCIFILSNPSKSKTNTTFCFFLISVACWASFWFLWSFLPYTSTTFLYERLCNLCAFFICVTFFHFATHLINEYERYRRIIYYLYIFNCLLALLSLFTNLIIEKPQTDMLIPLYPLAGKLFFIQLLEYILLPGYSLYIIHRKILNKSGDTTKLKIVFWGMLIGFSGGLTNYPMCFKIPIYPFGNILVPLFVVFISYGILRHQLMDIRVIIRKNLIYTIMVILISLLYFFSVFIIEHYFKSIFGYKSFLISIVFALIISLLFIPLKNFIQSFVEKILFKGNYLEITQENSLLRQEVAQTERLKSVAILASGLAHEIKNPLTALNTFAEYLPQKSNDPEFIKKFTPIVTSEVNRINALVHELLEFAKPAPVNLKPSNIHTLLDATLDFLSNDFLKNNIRIIKNYPNDQLTLISIDTNQFKQAILNIILNAIDAMPSGGTITITTETINQTFHLTIQDTGRGINPKDIPHIFDPFFTKKDHGTGLGLSVTHEIIKNHQGKIFVESKQDSGTTFIIELPYELL